MMDLQNLKASMTKQQPKQRLLVILSNQTILGWVW